MSDQNDKIRHDWSGINAVVKRSEPADVQPLPPDLPLSGIDQRIEDIRTQKLSILGRVKAGNVERKAALEEIRALNHAHLDAMKHALQRAVEVDKQRIDLVAQKYIYQITEEHLRDMRDMGIRNYEARMETLMRLNAEAAKLLKRADEQDVPDFIRNKTLEAIIKKYDEFYHRLTAEDAQLP